MRGSTAREVMPTDVPAEYYKGKSEVKKAFARRLVDGSTFGQLLALCPPFADLYNAVKTLVTAMNVPHVAYFSGGGGFRILFETPLAWRLVTWGQNYAAVFRDQELAGVLQSVAPMLPDVTLARIMAATDKNVYDGDKGTKPDLLAHFETHVFPQMLDAHFENTRPRRDALAPDLASAIRTFWARVFRAIPHQCPRIETALTDAATWGPTTMPDKRVDAMTSGNGTNSLSRTEQESLIKSGQWSNVSRAIMPSTSTTEEECVARLAQEKRLRDVTRSYFKTHFPYAILFRFLALGQRLLVRRSLIQNQRHYTNP